MSVTESPAADTVRFLVVDDSRAIQSIIRRCLEGANFPALEIRTASDAEAAYEILHTFKPDLIITDWHMPKISGLDFLKHLQSTGHPDLRVGFVTTESNPAKLDEARRHGALFVVNKPFEDKKFIEEVKNALAQERVNEIEVAVSAEGFIVKPSHCQEILASILPGSDLKLKPALPMLPTFLTAHNLLGLYGFGGQSQPVAALAVIDMKAVAILWGAASGAEASAVAALSGQQDVDDELLLMPRRLMEEVGPKIMVTPDKLPLALTRSSIVAQGFRRLHEIMVNRDGRADFTLVSPKYGSGHICFLMV